MEGVDKRPLAGVGCADAADIDIVGHADGEACEDDTVTGGGDSGATPVGKARGSVLDFIVVCRGAVPMERGSGGSEHGAGRPDGV